jgi:hypothetical protein
MASHFAELARSDSPAGVALVALANGGAGGSEASNGEGGEVGDLAVVVHLAPQKVATSPEYKAWIDTCPHFLNGSGATVQHIAVHGGATGGAWPLVRSLFSSSS